MITHFCPLPHSIHVLTGSMFLIPICSHRARIYASWSHQISKLCRGDLTRGQRPEPEVLLSLPLFHVSNNFALNPFLLAGSAMTPFAFETHSANIPFYLSPVDQLVDARDKLRFKFRNMFLFFLLPYLSYYFW